MKRRKAVQSLTALLGYSISPVMITGLASSCKDAQKEIGWKPNFFEETDMPILAKLGEAFLPKTETPGAIDVDAHLFVDVFLDKVATPDDREIVKKGFAVWKNAFQKSLGDKPEEALQEDFDKNLNAYYGEDAIQNQNIADLLSKEPPSSGPKLEKYEIYNFLGRFKALLMLGYFVSEEVGENVLSYLPVPGDYEGCIPVSSVGNYWSIS